MLTAIIFALAIAPQDKPTGATVATPSADFVVQRAEAQAKKTGKNVMVLFHASWCGWCHKLDDYMNLPSVKPLFAKSYEIVHLTVLESKDHLKDENAGGLVWLEKLGGTKQGIPYFAMLNPAGKVLANSKRDGKENVGFPASAEEKGHFMTMLKTTSKLTSAELTTIETVLTEAGKAK